MTTEVFVPRGGKFNFLKMICIGKATLSWMAEVFPPQSDNGGSQGAVG